MVFPQLATRDPRRLTGQPELHVNLHVWGAVKRNNPITGGNLIAGKAQRSEEPGMIIKRAAWFQSVPAIFILFLEGAPLAYRHTMNETSAHHRRNTHRIEIIHRCTRHCVSRIPLAGSRADSLIGETSSCPFRFFFDWREREREREREIRFTDDCRRTSWYFLKHLSAPASSWPLDSFTKFSRRSMTSDRRKINFFFFFKLMPRRISIFRINIFFGSLSEFSPLKTLNLEIYRSFYFIFTRTFKITQ